MAGPHADHADHADHAEGRGLPSAQSAPRSGGDELAVRLAALARSLQDEHDVQHTLQAIVGAAADTVPGARHAAISVVRHRREVITAAGTDELVMLVDEAQYETGQGPCLSAMFEQQTFRLDDMGAEQRWPEFTRRAAELGIGSMCSFQLFVQQDNLGALNLYSPRPRAFDDRSEHVGLLFASHAAVAMSGAQRQEHLNQAVLARDLIGQAKGILMERFKLTADQAFAVLARASQESNTKLIEVARQLADSGHIPPSR